MTTADILFYLFAGIATISSLLVILLGNPIYSALFLALTMSVIGALYFMLNAAFVSVAQITVYAGAVMVLFVMVVMLFDLKKDIEDVFKVSPISVAKVLAAGMLCGFFLGTGWLAGSAIPEASSVQTPADEDVSEAAKKNLIVDEAGTTKILSEELFSRYVFGFEAVGLVLIVVIVGSVALAKSRGGTHHVAS